MGCDGGTIPKRHELVKTKQKPEEKDRDSERATQWTLCALSSQLLKEPIVACELGRLYNKDALIEYLLDKSSSSSNQVSKMSHIKGLKSVYTLNLSLNPSWNDKAKNGDGYHDTNKSKYICPVSSTEMNGRYRFCFLTQCKCVLSHKMLKEIKGELCPSCSKPYDKVNDVIIINPKEEEAKVQLEKMVKRQESKKEKRKAKKDKTTSDVTITKASNDVAGPSSSSLPSYKNLKRKVAGKTAPEMKKVPESEIFKSLFTTHKSAKRSKDQISCWEPEKCK